MTSTTKVQVPAAGPWEAPGAGSWVQLADHFPGPVTPEYARTFIETMVPANTAMASRYGIPLAGLDAATVHGHLYIRPIPLVGANARSLPPPRVLRVAAKLHPRLRACARAATRALAERPWLAVTADWHDHTRGAWFDRDLALQRIEPVALDDAALADHVRACRATWRDGYRLHFELHGSDLLPIGAYIVRGEQLGLARELLLAALTGWSPASTGSDERLVALRAAIRDVLGDAPPPASLDAIRALAPAVDRAVDAYLEWHGWRMVTGYDLEGLTLGELPSLLVARLRGPEPPDPAVVRAEADAAAAQLRASVPAEVRAELDRLLADARATYGLRDDNGALVGAWPVGLTRRAYLEAGRRLAARGALRDERHVFDLLADEVAALLCGQASPSAATVAGRVERRAAQAASEAPLALGPPMVMPDASVLPRDMALMTSAQLLLAEDTGLASSERLAAGGPLVVTGTGIGSVAAEGIARVADDPAEVLALLESGEVIVTRSTNPAWNAVLPLAAALVVEEGGALSHAAIISRELGLPAVIGAPAAMATIRTGDRVRVDGATGTVTVLDR